MDRKRLLPKLRHHRWMGWTELPGRDLLEMPVKGLPRVAVGEDTRERYSFVQHTNLDASTTFADLEAIAVANLARRAEFWTVKEKSKGFLGMGAKPLGLELLTEFAAERLLDAGFMQQAHEQLKAPLLLAAIPFRGVLWVRPAGDVETTGAFLALARSAFEQVPKGLEPITPVVLSVMNGKPVGVVAGTTAALDEEIVPQRGFPWPVQGGPAAEASAEEAPADEVEESVDEDARRLHSVGYDKATRTVEYACYVEPGEKIPASQVRWIAKLMKDGMSNRTPVARVRIACPDRRVAEQIAPQIRPTGATIVFMNDAGEDQSL